MRSVLPKMDRSTLRLDNKMLTAETVVALHTLLQDDQNVQLIRVPKCKYWDEGNRLLKFLKEDEGMYVAFEYPSLLSLLPPVWIFKELKKGNSEA